jgi:hypothetical protein
MTQTPTKIEGIVTLQILDKVSKDMDPSRRKGELAVLGVVEPHVITDIDLRVNEAREYFRRIGIGGKNLDEISKALLTFYLRGFFVHRAAISSFDAKKLDEIYKMDYDAYLDRIIDEHFKQEGTKPIETPEIESIEPEKPENKTNLGSYLDE